MGRAHPGKIAGSQHSKGYWHIRFDGHLWLAHRLAWLIVHGIWPDFQIDHKDTVKHHNWIDNLREATRSQNAANQGAYVTNTSGFKGVYADGKRWKAQINIEGKRTNLGRFPTPELAAAAYAAATVKHNGEFART